MSASLKLVTLALLSLEVSCLPGPDPGTYHFSKTVWTKEAPSHDLKTGDFKKSIGNNITLVGGGSNKEGNVLLNGKPICDDKWDDRDAKVVCRMLGFSSDGAFATTQSQFGLNGDDFIMDNVQCKGAETNINDCYHSDKHNCGAGEGAGVRCRVSSFDDELKEELEEIKDENEKLQTKLSAQDSELRALRTKLDALLSSLTELQRTVSFDDTVLTDLISSSDDFSEHISSFNDSLTSLSTSVNDHETKLGSHHDQIHSVIVKTASNSNKIEGISTVVDGHKTKVANVTQDVLNLKASDQHQETRIVDNILKLNSVSTHGKWCGSRYYWNTTGIITYERLSFSDSNMNITATPLNINTGIFTVPVSGVWRVTFSMDSQVDSGEENWAWLFINSDQVAVQESWHRAYSESGRVHSTGGRDVTREVNQGGTIKLKNTKMEGSYYRTSFCAEYVPKM